MGIWRESFYKVLDAFGVSRVTVRVAGVWFWRLFPPGDSWSFMRKAPREHIDREVWTPRRRVRARCTLRRGTGGTFEEVGSRSDNSSRTPVRRFFHCATFRLDTQLSSHKKKEKKNRRKCCLNFPTKYSFCAWESVCGTSASLDEQYKCKSAFLTRTQKERIKIIMYTSLSMWQRFVQQSSLEMNSKVPWGPLACAVVFFPQRWLANRQLWMGSSMRLYRGWGGGWVPL